MSQGSSEPRSELAQGPDEGVVETELKFEVPPGARLPRLSGVGRVCRIGPARRMTQTATYHDTPDLTLLDARHTLRRRTGGTDAGWHLKTPGASADALDSLDTSVRREFHEPVGSVWAPLPMSLRERVAGIVGRELLLPVALLRTVRVRRELLCDDGRVLALLEDDTVQAHRPGRTTGSGTGQAGLVTWRELELELADGDATDLAAIAAALEAAGFQRSHAPSKLSRALDGLGLRPGPSVAVPPLVAADPSGERLAVWRYLAAQVGVIQALEADVLRDAPDAVHKMRVATRRLRATLRTVRPWLDPESTQAIRLQVRWLTRTLAGARDGEVVRERLLRAQEEIPRIDMRGPVRRRMARTLDATHAQAHAHAVQEMSGPRFARLQSGLVDFVLDMPWLGDAVSPDDLAGAPPLRELLEASRRRVRRRAVRADAARDPAQREFLLHEVRKKAKGARYAVEASRHGAILADAHGMTKQEAASAAGLDSWVDLQELLGDHQDAVVARDILRRMSREARAAGEDTYTYGVLVGRETQRITDGDRRMQTVLEAALD
ncbi:MAG: CYTH and CHAD domain-containing protein [Micrococcales bacterium]|nr:CYTH and CHAD domain-containing protein [Micrococcales bacterium]